jgi:hypothetical protein
MEENQDTSSELSQAEVEQSIDEAPQQDADQATEQSETSEVTDKQMQAAFTQKTQEIADQRKAYEQLQEKAAQFEKYEQYAPILEEMLSGKAQQPDTPEVAALEKQLRESGYGDDAIELMKMSASFLLQSFEQKQGTRDQQNRFQEQVTAAESVDARLNDESLVYDIDGENVTFGQLVADFVSASPGWKEDPVAATRKAIRKVDALTQKAKQQGKEELSKTTADKAKKFPDYQNSQGSTSNNSQPNSIREAAKEAMKELT